MLSFKRLEKLAADNQQNLGHDWGPEAFSEMTASAVNPVYQNAATTLAKKTADDRKRKATEKAKNRRRHNKYSKKDDSIQARKAYSSYDGNTVPDEITEDVLSEILEELKQSYYDTKVRVTKEEAVTVALDTIEQGSELWKTERRKRVTASAIGGIVKMWVLISVDITKPTRSVVKPGWPCWFWYCTYSSCATVSIRFPYMVALLPMNLEYSKLSIFLAFLVLARLTLVPAQVLGFMIPLTHHHMV